MERTKFLTIVIVALLLLNFGTLAFLFYNNRDTGPMPNGPGGPAAFIIKKLKFDEKQQEQFEELKHEHRSGMISRQDTIRELHEKMFDLLKTDNPDIAAADSIATVIAARKKEMDLFTFDHFRRVRLICNEEQKVLFDKFINEIQGAINSHPPHRGGPPQHRRP